VIDKPIRRFLLASPPSRLAIRLLECAPRTRIAPDHLLILTFHDAPASDAFAAQLNLLSQRFQFVSGADVLAHVDGSKALPARSCWITFDDALTSFAERAWPLLAARDIPTTLFVPTGFPDQPEHYFWWLALKHALGHTARREPLTTSAGVLPLSSPSLRTRAFKTLRKHIKQQPHNEAMAEIEEILAALQVPNQPNGVLGWHELRRLEREGCEMASHTRNHPMLDQLESAAVDLEIRGGIEDLAREVENPLPIFAYPAGQYNEQVVASADRAGVRVALTTDTGSNPPGTNPMCMRRVNVGPFTDTVSMRLRLAMVAARPPRASRAQ
tara:strand:- start:1473 stop:2453 length:981 start_codon:yes stop_codon:yes gene_type:complete